jgi:riboflavin synthase
MFSGIIEIMGRVEGLHRQEGGARLSLSPDGDLDCEIGDSLCVNGCCLTVAGLQGEAFEFDLSEETLSRSTLGGLKAGDLVNLERALKMGDKVGGHLVAGHVDAVGRVLSVSKSGAGAVMEFEAPAELMRLVAQKGSVAVDGVSLTSIEPGDRSFKAALIPLTLARTTLGFRQAGEGVNLEADTVARYVERILGQP